MKTSGIEFSRPLAVDRVPAGGSHEKLEADAKERAALALRLAVPALHMLKAEVRAIPWRGGLKVAGELTADLDQVSVVSLEPFRNSQRIAVERYFLPAGSVRGEAEAEADPIVKGAVDLGELIAETLALELDPYPRKPGEHFAGHIEFDEKPDAKALPFAALSKLRKP